MKNQDSILKRRDITLPTKVHLVKTMVFPVVMYGCGSWTIKKAEHQRINVFELWCWRRLLRVSWTARISNQSILKEINREYSLEGLMLKFHYFGHLMWKADSLEKTLMLQKSEGRKRRVQQRMRWLDGITDSTDMSLSKLRSWWWTGRPGVLQSTRSQRIGHDWATGQQHSKYTRKWKLIHKKTQLKSRAKTLTHSSSKKIHSIWKLAPYHTSLGKCKSKL